MAVSWAVKGGRVLGPAPFLLVGIVNVTPDSFHDGGRFLDRDKAVSRGTELLEQGAHVVDVGGESTRPYAEVVEAREEADRVVPVIRDLARCFSGKDASRFPPAISVDTYKGAVAAEALEAGAEIVNDVSACRFDPELADVVAQYKPGYVLMHSLGRPGEMQDDPTYGDVVSDISAFFEERLNHLVGNGVPEDRIVLDPGVGFGKLLDHNLEIMRGLEAFRRFGRPVFIGLSNKSWIKRLLHLDGDDRQGVTDTATALCFERGASIHRVHDVSSAAHALRLAQALGGRSG